MLARRVYDILRAFLMPYIYPMEAISLFDLHRQIRRVIALNFDETVFISAEVVKVNSTRGHWYLELAEKDENSNQIKAKSTAIIWRNQYESIRKKHGDILDEVLQAGIEIAFSAEIQYHEVYGLKLHIQDIDPSFTLGKETQRRLEIIQQLKTRKVLDTNSKLKMPSVIQKIAVISSKSAAGYADFYETLETSPTQTKYRISLFQASMQGENTEPEVRKQLELIQRDPSSYDLIVIIRGGGGKMDLRYFDNLNIALDIASSSLPVWVGIGHAIDQSVLDLVAHTSCKTPTAVAQLIEEHNQRFRYQLETTKLRLVELTRQRISYCRNEILSIDQELSYNFKRIVDRKYNDIQNKKEKLTVIQTRKLELMKAQLMQVHQRIEDLRPERILSRGYVALEQNQIRISSKENLELDQEFTITFKDGNQSISPKNN